MLVSVNGKPEQIGSPDDGQVPGVHVGLRRKRGHLDKMAHQKLQSPEKKEEERSVIEIFIEDTRITLNSNMSI